jgi:hypothetical protein
MAFVETVQYRKKTIDSMPYITENYITQRSQLHRADDQLYLSIK